MLHNFRFCALGSVYHAENPEFFTMALSSVFSQTQAVPVFLVVDGPIGPELSAVLAEFESKIERIVWLEENVGLASALNAGIEAIGIDYDYVIRFDSDDINRSIRFERLIEEINVTGIDLLGSYVKEFSEEEDATTIRNVPLEQNAIQRWMAVRNPFNHPSVVFKISAVREVGGYDDYRYFEDWWLWAKLIKAGSSMGNISDSLVDFRSGSNTLSRRRGLRYLRHEFVFFLALSKLRLHPRLLITISFLLRGATRFIGARAFERIYFLARKIIKD